MAKMKEASNSDTRPERVRGVLTASSTNTSRAKSRQSKIATIPQVSDSKYRARTGEVYYSAQIPFPQRNTSKPLESSQKLDPQDVRPSFSIQELKDLDLELINLDDAQIDTPPSSTPSAKPEPTEFDAFLDAITIKLPTQLIRTPRSRTSRAISQPYSRSRLLINADLQDTAAILQAFGEMIQGIQFISVSGDRWPPVPDPEELNMFTVFRMDDLRKELVSEMVGDDKDLTRLKTYDVGFDAGLFSRTVRLGDVTFSTWENGKKQDEKKLCPYTLWGAAKAFAAYVEHLPLRRKAAWSTLCEIFDYPSTQMSPPATPEFDYLAAAFFRGHTVPEVIDTSKPLHGPKGFNTTYSEGDRGKVLRTKPLTDPVLVVFLQDVIMANELEQACRNPDPRVFHYGMKVFKRNKNECMSDMIKAAESEMSGSGSEDIHSEESVNRFDMTAKAFGTGPGGDIANSMVDGIFFQGLRRLPNFFNDVPGAASDITNSEVPARILEEDATATDKLAHVNALAISGLEEPIQAAEVVDSAPVETPQIAGTQTSLPSPAHTQRTSAKQSATDLDVKEAPSSSDIASAAEPGKIKASKKKKPQKAKDTAPDQLIPENEPTSEEESSEALPAASASKEFTMEPDLGASESFGTATEDNSAGDWTTVKKPKSNLRRAGSSQESSVENSQKGLTERQSSSNLPPARKNAAVTSTPQNSEHASYGKVISPSVKSSQQPANARSANHSTGLKGQQSKASREFDEKDYPAMPSKVSTPATQSLPRRQGSPGQNAAEVPHSTNTGLGATKGKEAALKDQTPISDRKAMLASSSLQSKTIEATLKEQETTAIENSEATVKSAKAQKSYAKVQNVRSQSRHLSKAQKSRVEIKAPRTPSEVSSKTTEACTAKSVESKIEQDQPDKSQELVQFDQTSAKSDEDISDSHHELDTETIAQSASDGMVFNSNSQDESEMTVFCTSTDFEASRVFDLGQSLDHYGQVKNFMANLKVETRGLIVPNACELSRAVSEGDVQPVFCIDQGRPRVETPPDLAWADLLSPTKPNRARASSEPLREAPSEDEQEEYASMNYGPPNGGDLNTSLTAHAAESRLSTYNNGTNNYNVAYFPGPNRHVANVDFHHGFNMSIQPYANTAHGSETQHPGSTGQSPYIQGYDQSIYYSPGNNYFATTSSNPIQDPRNAQYAEMARLDKYRCTFCDVVFDPSPQYPVYFCPFCLPNSNICYCSTACLLADSYKHQELRRCIGYPQSERMGPSYCLTDTHKIENFPISHPSFVAPSPEHFRQKAFSMFCRNGYFPDLLNTWYRVKQGHPSPAATVPDNQKQIGDYYVFRSAQSVGNSNSPTVDVICAIMLAPGDPMGISMRRTLSLCFHNNDTMFTSFLFRLLRHLILDHGIFGWVARSGAYAPQQEIYNEFLIQFNLEFGFDTQAYANQVDDFHFWNEWHDIEPRVLQLEQMDPILNYWNFKGQSSQYV